MGASDGLEGVALALSDVPGGLALSGEAGWNQSADDWAYFIEQGHAIGFRTGAGALVATAAQVAYAGGFGWISMVLVDRAWRHRGLASLLVESCVKRLRTQNVAPTLDATPAGQPVYRHLGFRPGFAFERWKGHGTGPSTSPSPLSSPSPSSRPLPSSPPSPFPLPSSLLPLSSSSSTRMSSS
ncbi:MAG: GNAT family N-acetyltransferase, partial [Caldimonas sp.]